MGQKDCRAFTCNRYSRSDALPYLLNKVLIVVEAVIICSTLGFSLPEAVHQCGSSFLARGATQPKPEGCIAG